jgi:hypothetical protein
MEKKINQLDNFHKIHKKMMFINPYQFGVAFDPYASALIARMTAAGETPTAARQTAINNCIVSLKANSLFNTQFDVFVTTRGHGPLSTKMNWIKNANTATSTAKVTYTQNVGYNHVTASHSVAEYLNTNYTPSTSGNLLVSNNACFGIKASGTIGSSEGYHGGCDSAGVNGTELGYTAGCINGNSTIHTHGIAVGYNCVTRFQANQLTFHQNTNTWNVVGGEQGLCTVPLFIFQYDVNGGCYLGVDKTEVNELYWMGKGMTQAQFLTFQTIMNAYFATF